jgi:hypothetical protein
VVGCGNDCSGGNNRAEPKCNWRNQSVKLVASPSRNHDAREECKGRKHYERQGVDDLHRKLFPLPNTSAGWPYPTGLRMTVVTSSFHSLRRDAGLQPSMELASAVGALGGKLLGSMIADPVRSRSTRPHAAGHPWLPFLLGFGILVDAAARFAAQASGLHVLHQKRRRTIFFSQRFVQVFEDAEPRVESDQID